MGGGSNKLIVFIWEKIMNILDFFHKNTQIFLKVYGTRHAGWNILVKFIYLTNIRFRQNVNTTYWEKRERRELMYVTQIDNPKP